MTNTASFAALTQNILPLARKLLATAWPPNAAVVARNVIAAVRDEPWAQTVARAGRDRSLVEKSTLLSLRWLEHSQDELGSGGVGSYEFYGWMPGYPEVTGYTIPTFWESHHFFGRSDFAERAVRMAEWEIKIQDSCGGWEGGHEGAGEPPVVFNTGQVIRGLIRTYQETGGERFIEAAIRAADWIVDNQEDDGSWARANFMGMKRVYDSYVAAPLAELCRLTSNEKYGSAARRNCEFVLTNQHENGWFALCDNSPYFNDAPSTHTLCYTVDGLLETGELLNEERFVSAAVRTLDHLASSVSTTGRLAGRFDSNWGPRVGWVCLTGSAQLGIILMKLHKTAKEARYRDTALRLFGFLVFVQQLNSIGAARVGGIAGSFPIWGTYAPLKFPCWAPKYFVDLGLLVLKDWEAAGR